MLAAVLLALAAAPDPCPADCATGDVACWQEAVGCLIDAGRTRDAVELLKPAARESELAALGRLLAVILMSALFVMTTESFSLACALMRVGLPYRWGFTLVTALRLAPIFRLEAHHIYRAQSVRGVAYDAKGPRKWYLILRHLCLPLLVSAMRTAHCLSLSMEGRAFGLYPQRTYLREVTVGPGDVVAGILLLVSLAGAAYAIAANV